MRSTLLVPLLWTLVSAAHIKRNPSASHRHLVEDRDKTPPLEYNDKSLVKGLAERDPNQGQWLSLYESSVVAFSTSTRRPSPCRPTAINYANKGVITGTGDTTGELGGQSDQKGAPSYAQVQTSRVSTSSVSSTAAAGDQGSSGQVSAGEVQEWLKVHNEARKAHGAGPLTWSDDLSNGAMGNAMQCKGEHTAEKGENIASNTLSMSPQVAVGQWMGNAALYDGQFQESTAHYTQMIWKSTQYVGCYIQECAPGTRYDAKYGKSWQATCRYDPAGNNVADTAFEDNTQA